MKKVTSCVNKWLLTDHLIRKWACSYFRALGAWRMLQQVERLICCIGPLNIQESRELQRWRLIERERWVVGSSRRVRRKRRRNLEVIVSRWGRFRRVCAGGRCIIAPLVQFAFKGFSFTVRWTIRLKVQGRRRCRLQKFTSLSASLHELQWHGKQFLLLFMLVHSKSLVLHLNPFHGRRLKQQMLLQDHELRGRS